MPMPRRNTLIAQRNGKKVGLNSETNKIVTLLAAVANKPAWIERSSSWRGANLVASMPAANTIRTVTCMTAIDLYFESPISSFYLA